MAVEYYSIPAEGVAKYISGEYGEQLNSYITQILTPAAQRFDANASVVPPAAETSSANSGTSEQPKAEDVSGNYVDYEYIDNPGSEAPKGPYSDELNNALKKIKSSLKRALSAGYEFLKESQRLKEANNDNIPVKVIIDGTEHVLRFQPAVDDAINSVELKDKFKLKSVDGQGEGYEWFDKFSNALNPKSEETNGSITVTELRQIAPKIKEEVESILNGSITPQRPLIGAYAGKDVVTSNIQKLFGQNAKAEVIIGKQLGAIKESLSSHIAMFKEAVITADTEDKKDQPAIFQIKIKIVNGDPDKTTEDNLKTLINDTLIPQLNSKVNNAADKIMNGLQNFFKSENTSYTISAMTEDDAIKISSPTEAAITIKVEKKTSKSASAKLNNIANNSALGIKAKGI